MTDIINVIPLRVIKTRTGKCVLTFAIDDVSSDNYVGMAILEQWFDSEIPFSKIKDHIGQTLEGTYQYQQLKDGKAKIVLTALCDEDGISLLA